MPVSWKEMQVAQSAAVEFDNRGITLERLARTILEGLDATKTRTFWDGKEIQEREYPDHDARLKAVDIALKVRGDYAPEKRQHSGGVSVTAITPAQRQEVKALAKMMADNRLAEARAKMTKGGGMLPLLAILDDQPPNGEEEEPYKG